MDFKLSIPRSSQDKWIRGVCGGLAQRYDLPSWLVRAAFVLGAAVIPGVSLITMIVAYIILAVIMPAPDEEFRHRF